MSHPTNVILQGLNLTVLKIQIEIEIQIEENMNWIKLKRPPLREGPNFIHTTAVYHSNLELVNFSPLFGFSLSATKM